MAQPVQTWTTVRAFAAVAGEATAIPASGSMVDINTLRPGAVPRLVEFMLDPTSSPATANTPTSVVIKIYRALVKGDATRSLIATWLISPTDITNNEVVPIIIEGYASQYALRVSFVGGAAPTFTGTILARPVE